MKKILVAASILATASATFAQVSITGSVAIGYKSSTTFAPVGLAQTFTQALAGGSNGNASGTAGGLGVDTTVINVMAKEDLGQGYTISAELGLDGVNRAGVAGNDTALKLTTPVGRLTLKTYKAEDYLSGGFAAVGGVGMDSKVFPSRSLKDSIGFDTKIGPVYLGYAHLEQASVSSSVTPGVGMGIGAGGAGTNGQRMGSFSMTYVDGNVIANLNYLSYDGRVDAVNTSYRDVLRAAASYDFGVAKLGGGVSTLTTTGGATLNDSALSVSVPVGSALTLGANYAIESVGGALAQPVLSSTGVYAGTVPKGDLDQTRTGYGLSVTYALSKRTSISTSYANWTPYGVGVAQRNEETNLLLSHSF
jgi:hypothetical protein